MEGLNHLYEEDEQKKRIKEQYGDIIRTVEKEELKQTKKLPKLEHALEDDKDIVANVSKQTQKRLVKQQEYISEKLTEDVFDTLVMDDIPLSDTKIMIEQLKIYKALLEPVKSVYEEEQQNDIKKKSRKK